MSKPVVGILLGIVALLLVIGYIGVIPLGNDVREAATPTATIAGGETGDDAAKGEAIYAEKCSMCHSIDGSVIVGPSWQGLWGSSIQLEDGSTVVADENYIIESIREPGAKIHAGFGDAMPPFPESTLTNDDIASIIAFMQTLN